MEHTILKPVISGGIAWLTISRPQAMNALNSAFFAELDHFLDGLEKNTDVRVLVITGEGKAFVAGADIAEMAGMNAAQGLEFSLTGQKVFDRLEKLEIPVIAMVNGFALGGGCELAMACDFRIAGKSAKFGQPELNLGLIPGYAGTQRLSRLAGLGNALHLIMTCEMISADDALRIGLVQKVTDDENLKAEVEKIAGKLAANKSEAAQVVKKIIRDGYGKDFTSASREEASAFSALFSHSTTKEGMAAFLEKRKPAW
jgi:enoyl-CoA hydratase